MFGLNELENEILVTDEMVECPVAGCQNTLPRKKRNDSRSKEEFLCSDHLIYVTPSTFEYVDYRDNLIWTDPEDIDLLNRIFRSKRESRMGSDNSEDALTWNVFRFLEKEGLVENFIHKLLGTNALKSEIIYWSYSRKDKGVMKLLTEARSEFELVPSKGSEPDLIILTDKSLVFIEAKLTAGNNTTPSNMDVKDKYISSGGQWWNRVFTTDFQELSVQLKKYELARFWLLGTWMASRLGLEFDLINLVLSAREGDIEIIFGSKIIQNSSSRFRRMAWEDIFHYIADSGPSDRKDKILDYLQNKTIGYDGKGRLQKAFFCSSNTSKRS